MTAPTDIVSKTIKLPFIIPHPQEKAHVIGSPEHKLLSEYVQKQVLWERGDIDEEPKQPFPSTVGTINISLEYPQHFKDTGEAMFEYLRGIDWYKARIEVAAARLNQLSASERIEALAAIDPHMRSDIHRKLTQQETRHD